MPSQLLPVTNSSPEKIAIHALIQGATPPVLPKAQVLELGSGEGENLIPMAYWHRETSFCGFDSLSSKIEAGRRSAEELGLENLRLTSSEQELEPGSFDYILVSHVFSYVSDEAQRQILLLAERLLAPGGLLFLRYHPRTATLKRKRLRNLLLPLTDHSGPESEGEFFDLLSVMSALEPRNERQSESQLELKLVVANGPDGVKDHIRHREVFPLNPSEMRALAADHGLSFVGEMNHGGLESRKAAVGLRMWCSQRFPDRFDVEDLIDFYASPEYREEVYCREASPVALEQLLDTLLVEARLLTARPDVNLEPGLEVGFRTEEGQVARSNAPLEKAVLKHLCLSGGKAMPLGAIIESAWSDAEEALGEAIELKDEKLANLVAGLIDLVDQRIFKLVLGDADSAPGEGPIHAISRWQVERGYVLSTAHHELVALDDLTRAMVRELGRGRPTEELRSFVDELIERGELVFAEEAAKKSAKEHRKMVDKAVGDAVLMLEKLGLLRLPEP